MTLPSTTFSIVVP